MDLALNNLQWLICDKTKPKSKIINSQLGINLEQFMEKEKWNSRKAADLG